jgi:hypothetical protein
MFENAGQPRRLECIESATASYVVWIYCIPMRAFAISKSVLMTPAGTPSALGSAFLQEDKVGSAGNHR